MRAIATSAAATAANRFSPHVSELGQTLNIPDAYACKYFNKSGDKKTGGPCSSDAAAAAAQPMQTAMALICPLIILRFCHSQSADDAGEKQRRAAVGCGAGALVCEAWPVVQYCLLFKRAVHLLYIYVYSCPQMPFFFIVFVYFDKFIPAASQSSVFQTCLPGHQQNPRVIFLCGRRHFVCAVTI